MKKGLLIILITAFCSLMAQAQNVGVSNATGLTPQSLLHVHYSAAGQLLQLTTVNTTGGNSPTVNSGFNISIDGSKNIVFNQYEAAKMAFYTNNTERLTVLSDGNVGIGTAAPASKLDINGNVNVAAGNGTRVTIGAPTSAGTTMLIGRLSGNPSIKSSDTYLMLEGGGANGIVGLNYYATGAVLMANGGGNVGIGTATPGQKLDVSGGSIRTTNQLISTVATGTAPLAVTSNTMVSNLNADLLDGYHASSFAQVANAYVLNGNAFGTLATLGTNDAYNLGFETDGTTRMTINTSGSVGIGITSPSSKLDISEVQQSEFHGSNSAFPIANLIIRGTGTSRTLGTGSAIEFVVPANTDGSNPWAQARILGTPDNSSNSNAEGALYLQTRASYDPGTGGSWNWRTNMVLRASGNVGIGTTSPGQKLDVSGGSIRTTNQLISTIGIGTAPIVVTSTTAVANLNADMLDGYHYNNLPYLTNANISGTTNYVSKFTGTNAIGISQIFDNSTNVGVGNASPTQKLDVSGNIKSTGYGIFPAGTALAASGATDGKIFSPSGDYLSQTTWGINYNEGSPDYIEFNNTNSVTSRIALDDGSAHFALNGGSVGIGTTSPLSRLSVNGNGNAANAVYAKCIYTADGSSSSSAIWGEAHTYSTNSASGVNGVIGSSNEALNGTTGGRYCGITGYANRTTAASDGRAYGVRGYAGNATSGYNYGVYGSINGTNDGAGVFGTVGGADIGISGGKWAGYFNGKVNITSGLYANGTAGTSGQVLTSSGGGAMTWTSITPSANVDGTGTANYLARWTDANSLGIGVTYDNGTNVGIGTTSPGAKIHIAAGDASLALYGPNGSWGGKLFIGAAPNQAAASTAQVISTDGNLHLDPAPSKNMYLGYYQPRDIYINPVGGNVGIGTTGPQQKLNIIGTTRITDPSYSNPSGDYRYIDIYSSAAQIIKATNDLYIWSGNGLILQPGYPTSGSGNIQVKDGGAYNYGTFTGSNRTLDMAGNGGGLRLSANNWTDGGATYGHIVTSNSTHNALMIVGNNVAGDGHRNVRIWDHLNVESLLTRAGYTVWDAANDGSGSGLDADLLDGQHGSYYAPASASGNYIQNQYAGAQSANFWINGTANAATYAFTAPTGDPSPIITARVVPSGQGAANEKTELILFHSNDNANGAGIDQITLRAPALSFQTYSNAAVSDINNNAGYNERMYINPDGNVGIGTTSPAEKLDVTGNIKTTSLAGTGNRPVYADANGVLKAGANDNTNWTLSANFSYSPDDLWGHGGTSGGSLSADDTYASYTMPFSIVIEGTSYSTLSISTNGWVAFGSVSSSYLTNNALPTSTFPVPVICAYWDDLVPSGSYIRYGYVGASPNRTVIIDYEAHTYSGDYDVRFQVQIHEGSGLINVKYRDPMHHQANGQSATIGFQLAGGSSAKAYPITYNGKVLDDNRDDAEGWSVCPVR